MKDPKVQILVSLQSLIDELATLALEHRPETLDGSSSTRAGNPGAYFWFVIRRSGDTRMVMAKTELRGNLKLVCDMSATMDGTQRAVFAAALTKWVWSYLPV